MKQGASTEWPLAPTEATQIYYCLQIAASVADFSSNFAAGKINLKKKIKKKQKKEKVLE